MKEITKQDLLNRLLVSELERKDLAKSLSNSWEIIKNFRSAASLLLAQMPEREKLVDLLQDFIERTHD